MPRRKSAIKSFQQLWAAHEKLYCFVFIEALKRLIINSEQSKHEDSISEALYPDLVQVCFEHPDDVKPPDWEKPIPPLLSEELKGGKIRKRPDFTCSIINSFATSSEFYEIPFHVECKRLGEQVGTWNLNKNYLTNGIYRFDSTTHEYGKRASSGMMIGYIISMKPDIILNEVNGYLTKYPTLSFVFTHKVESCEQNIVRSNVKPNNFKLLHLWVDLIK